MGITGVTGDMFLNFAFNGAVLGPMILNDGAKSASLAVDGDIIVNSSDKKKAVKVGKKSQIKADQLLVTGGNAANFTSWFVVLQQSE